MYNSITRVAIFSILMLAAKLSFAQSTSTTVAWGSSSPAGFSYFTLGNSSDVLFNTTTNAAYVALGYFSDDFTAGDLQSVYQSFVPIAHTSIYSISVGEDTYVFDGAISAGNTIDTDIEPGLSAQGQSLYYFVLPGVTDYTEGQILAVAEYAIMTDSGWDTLAFGTDGAGSDTNIQGNTIDTVLWGTLVPDGGEGAGSSKILTGAAVPEPSTYAGLFGVAMLLVVHLRRRRQA